MNKFKTGIVASLIGISAITAASIPALTSAATLSWDRTYTGEYGVTHNISGNCASGSGCTRTEANTTANGYSWTRYGTAQGNGAGDINRSVTFTGEGGSSASFKWVR